MDKRQAIDLWNSIVCPVVGVNQDGEEVISDTALGVVIKSHGMNPYIYNPLTIHEDNFEETLKNIVDITKFLDRWSATLRTCATEFLDKDVKIVHDPDCSSNSRIDGTNVLVQTIIDRFCHGESIGELCREMDLEIAQIECVLRFGIQDGHGP